MWKRDCRWDREGESIFISVEPPSSFAWDQAGVCCDSPWVTSISHFIHDSASPQLISVCLPINCSHKTPPRLWLRHGGGGESSCQILSQPQGATDKMQDNQERAGSWIHRRNPAVNKNRLCWTNYVQYAWGCGLISILPLVPCFLGFLFFPLKFMAYPQQEKHTVCFHWNVIIQSLRTFWLLLILLTFKVITVLLALTSNRCSTKWSTMTPTILFAV